MEDASRSTTVVLAINTLYSVFRADVPTTPFILVANCCVLSAVVDRSMPPCTFSLHHRLEQVAALDMRPPGMAPSPFQPPQ